MLATFDNIITYGGTTFENKAELRHMVVDIFTTGMTSDQLGLSDRIAACKLADVFLLVLKTSIVDAIPNVVSLCLQHVADRKITTLRKWATLVILDALCFNVMPALQALESSQMSGPFFAQALLVVSKYTKVHEKKVVATAFMNLLNLDPAQTPATVQQGQSALLVGLLQTLVGLPKAIQKAKEDQEAFDNLDDDDEDASGAFSAADDGRDADDDVLDEDSECALLFSLISYSVVRSHLFLCATPRRVPRTAG